MKKLTLFAIFFLSLSLIISGCVPQEKTGTSDKNITISTTFYMDSAGDLCMKNGKPVVELFSTTWCPHCQWIKETFDTTISQYSSQIEAHHWELDTGDDTLTNETETSVPSYDRQIFAKYSRTGGVPTFVFGCKYFRVGNGYEGESDGLEKEQKDFKDTIERLLKEVNATK